MKRFNITVNGKPFDVTCEEIEAGVAAPTAQPKINTPPKPTPTSAPISSEQAGNIQVKAPMPGNINSIKVAVGDTVESGQVLVILEAMKMENEIMAPQAGKIISINVSQGDSVNSDQLICTMA